MSLGCIWSGSFHHLVNTLGVSHRFNLLRSGACWTSGIVLDTGRCKLRPVTTKAVGRSQKPHSSKPCSIRLNHFDGTVRKATKSSVKKSELLEFKSVKYGDAQQKDSISLDLFDGTIRKTTKPRVKRTELLEFKSVRQKVVDGRDSGQSLTIFVFDIETTGFSRQNDRIIEFALQDLLGGKNSTFQTLVNPERYVPNADIHGISTHMVNRPDVPRWKDLVPILLQYVQSRQKIGEPVLWVAHNGRRFDVPFFVKEFSRCSVDVPQDWQFVDTLPLARQLVKPDGSKLSSSTLGALREYYGIPLIGSAHRAMSDVNSLSLILQKLTFDLKVPVSGLLERSFKASDIKQTLS